MFILGLAGVTVVLWALSWVAFWLPGLMVLVVGVRLLGAHYNRVDRARIRMSAARHKAQREADALVDSDTVPIPTQATPSEQSRALVLVMPPRPPRPVPMVVDAE